jgi:hypothetical protein
MVVFMSLLCYYPGIIQYEISIQIRGFSMQNLTVHRESIPKSAIKRAESELIDAFELDDETLEPEPEPGDFWGELDDDRDANG